MPQQSELSLEEFAAGLSPEVGEAPQASQELSVDDFAAGLTAGPKKRLSLLGAAGGSALEGLASMAGELGMAEEGAQFPQIQQAIQGSLGAKQVAPPAPQGEGPGFFGQAEQFLRGKAEELYPQAVRGTGGLPEQLTSGAGSIAVGAGAAALGGPAGAAFAFGAMEGVPLYYDILSRTGGDKEAATVGLLFGNLTGQLEKFGAEGILGGTLSKLARGKLGKALLKTALTDTLKGAAGEAITEAAQQGLSDAALESLTGDDVENIKRMVSVIPPALILGGGAKGLSILAQAVAGKDGAAPAAPEEKAEAGEIPTPAPAEVAPETVGGAPEVVATTPQEVPQAQAAETVPEPGMVRLYRGQKEDILGGQYFTTDRSEAKTYGDSIRYVDVPEGVAEKTAYHKSYTRQPSGEEKLEFSYHRLPPEIAAKQTKEIISSAGKQPSSAFIALKEGQVSSAEAAQGPQKTTGIKNATVEKELTEMGIPLPEKAEREGFVQWHADAVGKMKKDADAGRKLVDELAEHPRAVDENEKALMALEANKRITEREEADKAFLENPTEANRARIERAKADYKKAADVFQKAGTTAGRALSARKMMIARDESLAAIERSLSVAKGGKELTEQETARARELFQEIDKTRKAYEERISALEKERTASEEKQIALEAENILLKKKKLESKAKRKQGIEKTKAEIDEILNRLANRSKAAAGLGALDAQVLADVTLLAGKTLKLGAQTFADFSATVVGRLGESIRPYLQPAWDQAKADEEQAMLKTYKSRKETEIRKLKERAAAKQFTIKRRVTPVHRDPEAIRLKAKYETAKRKYEAEKTKFERENRTGIQKAQDFAKEMMDLPTAVEQNFDLSAVRRQAGFFTKAHPLSASKAFVDMLHSFASPEAAAKVQAWIDSSKYKDLGDSAGLEFTSTEGLLLPGEDVLKTHLTDKIPGIGGLMRGGNRAFVTYVNLARRVMFDHMIDTFSQGDPTLAEAQDVAGFVNNVTGRSTGKGKQYAVKLAGLHLFRAPNYVISRFQVFQKALQTIAPGKMTWRTRKAIGMELARYIAGSSIYYMALGAFGAAAAKEKDVEFDIETDWRSSDFGKVRIGRMRIDPMEGFAQPVVLIAKIVSNMSKSTKTGKLKELGGEGPFDQSALDVAIRFVRSKLGAVPGRVWDALEEETYTGEKVTRAEALLRPPVPFAVSDIASGLNYLGVPAGVITSVLSILGDGVMVYDQPTKTKKKREIKRRER